MTALRFTDPRPGPAPRRACVATRWRRPWRPVAFDAARMLTIFQCRECLRWRPWSEGGVPDLRCDHCVLADRRRGLCSQ